MKVAILGATGMLGHHAARWVAAAGHELRVIHRPGSRLERLVDLKFETARADLAGAVGLAPALAGVAAVIHAAGYYPRSPAPWTEHRDRAATEMRGFLDACRQASLRQIVYVGGSIVLRRPDDGSPAHEEVDYGDQPPPVKNGYVQAKWIMDRLAREAAAEDLPVTIGIPAMTLGELDYGPTTGRIVTEVANGSLPGFVEGKRNVIYAEDAGRGLVGVLEGGRPGERYLLTGVNTTTSELVRRIAELAGVRPPRRVPMPVAKAVARVQTLRHKLGGPRPKLDDTALAVMGGGQHLSGRKAREELGFVADRSLDDILRSTYRWFEEQGYIGQ